MGCATAPAYALGLHSKESELYNACAFLKYTGSLTPHADLHRFNRQKRSSVILSPCSFLRLAKYVVIPICHILAASLGIIARHGFQNAKSGPCHFRDCLLRHPAMRVQAAMRGIQDVTLPAPECPVARLPQ